LENLDTAILLEEMGEGRDDPGRTADFGKRMEWLMKDPEPGEG
jgi:hypothetical protein